MKVARSELLGLEVSARVFLDVDIYVAQIGPPILSARESYEMSGRTVIVCDVIIYPSTQFVRFVAPVSIGPPDSLRIISELRHEREDAVPYLIFQLFERGWVLAVPIFVAVKERSAFVVVVPLDGVENIQSEHLIFLEPSVVVMH